MMRIAQLAERFSVPVAPHSVQHVSLHLAASLPGILCVEVFQPDNPLREFALELIEAPREAVEIDEGTLRLPTAPWHRLPAESGGSGCVPGGLSLLVALQSGRDLRIFVIAMEAPAFWHEQEGCSCVSS